MPTGLGFKVEESCKEIVSKQEEMAWLQVMDKQGHWIRERHQLSHLGGYVIYIIFFKES